jgi:hypothetical protein
MKDLPKRPRTISLVLILLVILGFIQVAKVVALNEQSALLLDLQVTPDPRLRMVIAAIWMVVFWVLAIALWRKITWTRWLVPALMALYVVYELAVLRVFAQVPISNERWFLNSFLAVALVSFAFWALNRSAVIPYYLEDEPANE